MSADPHLPVPPLVPLSGTFTGGTPLPLPNGSPRSFVPPALPPEGYADLAPRRQWLCWRKIPNENGKFDKVPCDPKTGHKAKWKNSDIWCDLETACAAVDQFGFDGVGYVFSDDDDYSGIDIDNCRNPETGEIKEWAKVFIHMTYSYTEISPSGTGLHIFVKGKLPPGIGNKKPYADGVVEIYSRKRFLTVTGNHERGTPGRIEKRQEELETVHEMVFGRPGEKAEAPTTPRSTAPLSVSDADLIERASHARNGETFSRLWAGDYSGHPSRSEADLALCRLLAFWTGNDQERIDRLFRLSGLYREKWEREDYRSQTIEKACSKTLKTYSPGTSAHQNGTGAVSQPSKEPKHTVTVPDELLEQVDGREPVESDEEQETEEKPKPRVQNVPYPEPIGKVGYYGIIGKIVKAMEPHTEADPNFLLVCLVVAAGNYLDRKAYIEVSGVRHYTNLFVCAVGPTGTGRKGTAMENTFAFLQKLEDSYTAGETSCIEWAALSSGEGLTTRIKDPVMKPGKEPGSFEVAEPGRLDKRVISIQDELGSALQNMKRSGNNLSSFLRIAWDGRDLGSLTKSPYRATNPHVSMITGITREELLSGIEDGLLNGFANRFLWCCSKQSKMLPEGGRLHEVNLEPYASRFMHARKYAALVGLVERDEEAKVYWGANSSPSVGMYADLNQPRVGKFASCVTRVHVMVLRMSLILALLDYHQDEDGNTLPCEIRKEHLLAAEEIWRYCEDSARYVFGGSTGSDTADSILKHLRSVRPEWTSRSEISRKVFGHNKTAGEITAALSHLLYDYAPPLIEEGESKNPGAKKPTRFYRLRRSGAEATNLIEAEATVGGESGSGATNLIRAEATAETSAGGLNSLTS